MLAYIGIAFLIVLIAFMWFYGGLGKGRKYGNKIAKHLGMSNNFFHTVLEYGVKGPSLQLLAMLDNSEITIEQSCVQLAPSLQRGLIALEEKYGSQKMIMDAKPIVSHLMIEWENFQQQGKNTDE